MSGSGTGAVDKEHTCLAHRAAIGATGLSGDQGPSDRHASDACFHVLMLSKTAG